MEWMEILNGFVIFLGAVTLILMVSLMILRFIQSLSESIFEKYIHLWKLGLQETAEIRYRHLKRFKIWYR